MGGTQAMTLAQELRRVQGWVERGRTVGFVVSKLAALAEKCDGKVLVKPTTTELSWGSQASADDNLSEHVGEGETPTEALSDLQRRLDEACVCTDDSTD